MKNLKPRLKIFILSLLSGLSLSQAFAQCSQTTLNWDYLDFFTYSGTYASGYLPNINAARNQYFTFGTQRVHISHNYGSSNFFGDDGMHTGENNAYGTGEDIHFRGNGTITIDFENEVQNVQFSLFDVDYNQDVSVSAVNAASSNLNVSLSQANLNLNVTINPFPLTAPSAKSNNSRQNNTSSTNTINVDVAGPVKTITISITNTATRSGEDGSFWISDITACSSGTFASNYYNVAQPFTGQRGYVLNAFNNSVYALDPTNGYARLLFTDNLGLPSTGSGYINSMAYDPYGRKLYYVYSLTGDAANNRLIRVYDMDAGTISTAVADVNSIGIPTTARGVESGAGAFYDGSFYIGIEANETGFAGGREAIIWRIDFDGSGNAYRASQMFGIDIDNGSGTLLHDWADFTITDGILYDFDGAGSSSSDQTGVFIHNMITGNTTVHNQVFTNSGGTWLPGQPTVGWDNTIYQVHANTASAWPTTSPYIATYNPGTNTIGTKHGIFSSPMYSPAIPSLGDAAEGFRPNCDFGDAPASYDPVALSPAVHEYYNELRLGANWGAEWQKKTSALADGDDEDGVPYTNPFNPTGSSYYNDVDVYNNTGADATLIGWLDMNGNGVFDAGEASAVKTISSSASIQTIHLDWSGYSSSLPLGSFTFMRVRLAPASDAMTAANATGFYETGEVEDYRIYVGLYPLAVKLLSFDAKAGSKGNAELSWIATEEADFAGYSIEKSLDGLHWSAIDYVSASHQDATRSYNYSDKALLTGKTYYRLQLLNMQPTGEYSEIRVLSPAANLGESRLAPNPASGQTTLQFSSRRAGDQITIRVLNLSGYQYYNTQLKSTGSIQQVRIPVSNSWSSGTYLVLLHSGDQLISHKLIVK